MSNETVNPAKKSAADKKNNPDRGESSLERGASASVPPAEDYLLTGDVDLIPMKDCCGEDRGFKR